MEEHPKYQAGHESEEEHWPTTDELVAQVRANRQGEEYPTPEQLLENLPVVLRGLCDYALSGEADAYHIAYTIASLIDVIENTKLESLVTDPNNLKVLQFFDQVPVLIRR